MKTSRKTITGVIVFALFLVVAVLAYNALSDSFKPGSLNTDATKTTGILSQAPDFTVYDAKGKEVHLSDYAGKPVVLNFWASWCPPCKAEMPGFNKVYASVKDDVVFMMVDLVDGQRETQAKGQQYVKDQGFTFPIYFDTKGDAASKYNVMSIPTSYFISADGKIVTLQIGAMEEEDLLAAIDLIKK